MAPGGAARLRKVGICSKKSSRVTCFGTTTSVSISEPSDSQHVHRLEQNRILSDQVHKHRGDSSQM